MVDPILTGDGESVTITSNEWNDISDSINALFCSLFKCCDVDDVERIDLARAAYSRLNRAVSPIHERILDSAHPEGGEA